MPVKPANFDWGNVPIQGTAEYQYMIAKDQYDMDMHQYQFKMSEYNTKKLSQVLSEVEVERDTRSKQQQLSDMKTKSIRDFVANGLTMAEAQQCWTEATTKANEFFDAKGAVAIFKLKHGMKSNPKGIGLML